MVAAGYYAGIEPVEIVLKLIFEKAGILNGLGAISHPQAYSTRVDGNTTEVCPAYVQASLQPLP